MTAGRTLVVGAGAFGAAAAVELVERGHRVTLFDAGPIPNPRAASSDISKVIRMEYGADETYMALAEEAREGWLRWNAAWTAQGGDPLFHETGVVMVSRGPMSPGGFEHDSWDCLNRRGHAPERLDATSLAARFPAWSTGQYVDGFFHALGGYAESTRVVQALIADAARAGADVREHAPVAALLEREGNVTGVRLANGVIEHGEHVVVAAGAWTAQLTGLSTSLAASGHPVFHLRPRTPALFRAERFPTFTADIANTGYYGFPLDRDGIVKIGHHGAGIPSEPDGPRDVGPAAVAHVREFAQATFPALADAELVLTRLCLYTDTPDEDFWIARDPERPALTVATGGSGHGFKFTPVLGSLIADAVDGIPNSRLDRFAWRPAVRLERGRDAARFRGTLNEAM